MRPLFLKGDSSTAFKCVFLVMVVFSVCSEYEGHGDSAADQPVTTMTGRVGSRAAGYLSKDPVVVQTGQSRDILPRN